MNRPNCRTLLQIETRQPSGAELADQDSGKTATLDFISSTATVDRFHETIDPAGWQLETYRRNPVFQNAHQYGDVIFTLGKALITEVRSGDPSVSHHSPLTTRPFLFQRIQFATDVNPIARIAYGLYKGAFLHAVSVGFIPLRWEDTPPGRAAVSPAASSSPSTRHSPLTKTPRRKYLEQELLEVSAVAIPANPDALALAIKSGAVEKSDLRESLALVLELEQAGSRHSGRPVTPVSDSGIELFQLARELRRILRHA
jgi:hypothetical protein